MLGSVVAILVVGAMLAPLFGPEYHVAEDQTTEAQYYFVSQNSDAIVRSAGPAGHNPKAAAGAIAAGIVIFIVGVYAVLYGGALWFGGIVCGSYLGWMLHRAFTAKPPQNETPGDASPSV